VSYLGWDRRLEMLHDVASGMMYLHRSRYVHGDLRSPNLFVGIDGRVSATRGASFMWAAQGAWLGLFWWRRATRVMLAPLR
jgi:serine/threonine protein kinase